MTERPPSRLYLPWLSWLVLGLTALAVLVIISVAAVFISSHQFRNLMKLLVVILVLLVASSVLLVKFRRRFDQYIQTDGETFLRFWSPTREITIDRADVSNISSSDRQVVVEGPDGSITIDRRYPEFESLRRVIESWRPSGGRWPNIPLSGLREGVSAAQDSQDIGMSGHLYAKPGTLFALSFARDDIPPVPSE